eukprot:CAMPEP_0206316220 /NCGR_PEP_ID=MMETSP0106_2-20121207/15977_1 /ASSEMBLY_ACC=CAM_ASM_000206 /TAXON_ID=81532 /ORGANISM="Acanthoeca-like sp., Strain 10tr" /LENGTH=78 /DNA_ID=CAMNT_0053747713 /DNA_START=287 /DNA_END=522 /DNA_ORIENTATION=-
MAIPVVPPDVPLPPPLPPPLPFPDGVFPDGGVVLKNLRHFVCSAVIARDGSYLQRMSDHQHELQEYLPSESLVVQHQV